MTSSKPDASHVSSTLRSKGVSSPPTGASIFGEPKRARGAGREEDSGDEQATCVLLPLSLRWPRSRRGRPGSRRGRRAVVGPDGPHRSSGTSRRRSWTGTRRACSSQSPVDDEHHLRAEVAAARARGRARTSVRRPCRSCRAAPSRCRPGVRRRRESAPDGRGDDAAACRRSCRAASRPRVAAAAGLRARAPRRSSCPRRAPRPSSRARARAPRNRSRSARRGATPPSSRYATAASASGQSNVCFCLILR